MRKITFEQIARPALAIVFIMSWWITQPNAEVESPASAKPTVVRHYTMPCVQELRAAHPEIPNETQAYLNWREENPAAAAEWSAQLNDCTRMHVARHGKWNWDSMILTHVTEIP